jgi:hypothetical protein
MTVPDSPLRAASRAGNLEPTTWSLGDYADGGEQAVLEHIRASSDLSSLSDELSRKASTWAERYHLSPDRANILRAIQLHGTDKVLEVGAGCGAITRYLGEVCALVDAVEPEPARAHVAAERTRDLESVRVFATEIDRVPEVPFYDVAFVIGVLEYVGAGSDDIDLYVDFLRKVAARLTPQGTLVCAIENQFGVKYLSGAPEDHTGLPFDGVTGYQEGNVARTFSRHGLADLFRRAELEVTFLHAFPDYKLARVVFADDVFDEPNRWVAIEIPQFPSPERTPGPPRVVDEERVWAALVRAGEASRFANSFVVLASPSVPARRWPPGRLAAFFGQGRARIFRTESVLERGPNLTLHRRAHDSSGSRLGTLEHVSTSTDMVGGERLDLALASMAWPDIARILGRWRELVLANPGLIDLIPGNIRISGSELIPFDQEWRDASYTANDIIGRGLLSIFFPLRDRLRVKLELPASTDRELLTALGTVVGLDPSGAWIDAVIKQEANLQVGVSAGVHREPPHGCTPASAATTSASTSKADPRHQPPQSGAAPFGHRS